MKLEEMDGLIEQLKKYPVEDQHNIAKALAANCGYKLIAEDSIESLEIKEIIRNYKNYPADRVRDLVIQGLEGLLK